ncbi:MAG: cytochrome c [Bdellovibrionales bacterium]
MKILLAMMSFSFAMSQGEYVFRLGGCVHCHTVEAKRPLTGGRSLVTPFGTFYTPNISPDPETGIGRWTYEQFSRALRQGVAPDGRVYYPSFPYSSFAQLTDEDTKALWEFMTTMPPFHQVSRVHDLSFPFNQSFLMRIWRTLFFSPSQPPTRGSYLVESMLHCAECHTPRNSFGAFEMNQWMAGSSMKFDGRVPPNLTPDPETGLGSWTEADWVKFLSSGILPSGRTVGSEMASVISATAVLRPEDRKAVVDYFRSLPPIHREKTK